MSLSNAQLVVFKAALLAETNPELVGYRTNGQTPLIAEWYSRPTAAYWVWRTEVSRSEIYNSVSPDASTWNWTTYKNQGVTEQNAWTQMFMGDRADFSKANLRAGVAAIFTGSAQANAQRDHVLSMGRRLARKIEELLATGTGLALTPSTMGYEGALSESDVTNAIALP